ncbi:hypothetical protein [Arthrobacter sp. NicSoilC5]|uniref:hypothetical protein n=1 Tax=Arthrobacter sp. NicSoilC5 TaxID=2831000 RepID=UPI001CC44BAB|nr:hypothetical protein [Arthrobacter sp. NicSoilC5]
MPASEPSNPTLRRILGVRPAAGYSSTTLPGGGKDAAGKDVPEAGACGTSARLTVVLEARARDVARDVYCVPTALPRLRAGPMAIGLGAVAIGLGAVAICLGAVAICLEAAGADIPAE